MDDEAEGEGDNSNDDNSDGLDSDMEDFIDDDSNLSEPDFELRKKVEIELNRVAVRKFLEAQEDSFLKEIGIGFIYSKPSDLSN